MNSKTRLDNFLQKFIIVINEIICKNKERGVVCYVEL